MTGSPSPPTGAPGAAPALASLGRFLGPISSLRLTVVLLAMAIFLVFAGTWAQIDRGIWTVLEQYFRTFWTFIPIAIFFPRDWSVPGVIPFPGGWLIGGAMLVNLLAAHTVRFRWSKDRIGILLIHVSLILLLLGEMVTGLFAVESRMSIDEGETAHYAEDTRSVELAIVDPSDPERDRVVVIPQRALAREKRISDPLLPFDVEVNAFHINADLVQAEKAPARALHGNRGLAQEMGIAAMPKAPASGVGNDEMDVPVAQITLYDGDRELGVWITSLMFDLMREERRQFVEVGDRVYDVALRFVRHYKPYSVHLQDFKHDRYLGTDTPKNFSSSVRLLDPARNVDREVLIWMNHPLRYRGETFYQASFKQNDQGTVLQIVRNPGWLLPYVACTLGAIGMIVHFTLILIRFLRRRTSRRTEAARQGHGGRAPESGPAVAATGDAMPGRATP